MAVNGYFGKPGAGKSYALVSEVIVRGVLAGRRVLTNVAGVDPEKVRLYCFDKADDPSAIGEVVLFHGEDAQVDGFWPVQGAPAADAVVQPGDLVVFDEWAVYFPRRGKQPNQQLVPFLRYHRHYVSDRTGHACDIAIATQIPSDLHLDYRGLIQTSYNFVKLTAVGATKAYKWRSYQGHLLNKETEITVGGGVYDPEIFPLYKSYDASASATELKTDSRDNIWKRSLVATIVAGVIAVAIAIWWVWAWFHPEPPTKNQLADRPPASSAGSRATAPVPWRIIGQVVGDQGVRVVVVNDAGAMRVLPPDTFRFDGDRPVSGNVDGARAEAEQFVQVDPSLIEVGQQQQAPMMGTGALP